MMDTLGSSPDELRHGTFGRFRLVVNIDSLDKELRSNRESVREGPLLETARDVLRAIFNFVRPFIEKHDEARETSAQSFLENLPRVPQACLDGPLPELARAVVEGNAKSRYLIVPRHRSREDRDAFLANTLEESESGRCNDVRHRPDD